MLLHEEEGRLSGTLSHRESRPGENITRGAGGLYGGELIIYIKKKTCGVHEVSQIC